MPTDVRLFASDTVEISFSSPMTSTAGVDLDQINVNGSIGDSVAGLVGGKLRVVMTDVIHDGDPWALTGPAFGGTYASGQPIASGSGLVSA